MILAQPARPTLPPSQRVADSYADALQALGANAVNVLDRDTLGVNFADSSGAYVASYALNDTVAGVELLVTPRVKAAKAPSAQDVAEFAMQWPGVQQTSVDGRTITLGMRSVRDAQMAVALFKTEIPGVGRVEFDVAPEIVPQRFS